MAGATAKAERGAAPSLATSIRVESRARWHDLSMVLATMVEDLLSDQNLIGVSPRSTRSGRYPLIVRATAIVGSSVTNRARDMGSATGSPTKVRTTNLSFSVDRRAWGDGTQSVVSIRGVGKGSLFARDKASERGRGAR